MSMNQVLELEIFCGFYFLHERILGGRGQPDVGFCNWGEVKFISLGMPMFFVQFFVASFFKRGRLTRYCYG